ncbi:MAG: ATP-binding protein [Planctomycetota bacterium]
MSRRPNAKPEPVGTLPGTHASCALLTVLTILLAWPEPPAAFAAIVRPAYFALLAWFFWRRTRNARGLDGQPMRLVRGGFLILFVAFTTSAAIQIAGVEAGHGVYAYLRYVCERGALFLLGTTLIAYGLMLWIPQVLTSHRLLAEHAAAQDHALHDAEAAQSRLEDRLVDADRRAMLGELAASIAHDLRNPLTIVKGTAESLCRRPRTSHEVAEHTAVIRRNIDKADRTIEALIGLARPRQTDPADVAATELLAEVADLVHVEARRRSVKLTVAPERHGRVVLRTDRTLCSQALLNLLLNAVQATGHGGEVRLFASAVRRAGRELVLFAVEDRGVGLPPSVRRALFTPFFTTKATGTGLGLASCRRIAHELGGSLRLYPRTGGGTRALFLLATAPPATPASAAGTAAADEQRQWANTGC